MTKILIARTIFNAFILYLLGRLNVITVTHSWHLFEPYQFKNIDAIITLGTVGNIFYSTAIVGKACAKRYSWLWWIPTCASGIISFMILFWLDSNLLAFYFTAPYFWMIVAGLLIWGANEIFNAAITPNTETTTNSEEKKA